MTRTVKPQPAVSVVKGVTKAQLVEMAMRGYIGSTRELQKRQYERMTKTQLALLVQNRTR